jgi:hypothetical protein
MRIKIMKRPSQNMMRRSFLLVFSLRFRIDFKYPLQTDLKLLFKKEKKVP